MHSQNTNMKKWFIPLGGLLVVGLIAFATQQFILKKNDGSTYKVYMIALKDNGRQGPKVGCDDSVVAVERQTVRPTGIFDVYQDVVGEKEYDFSPDLKNPLYASDLNIDSASIDDRGIAHIFLNGTLKAGDRCQNGQIKAQLEEPALQFGGVKSVEVQVNGQPISDLLK